MQGIRLARLLLLLTLAAGASHPIHGGEVLVGAAASLTHALSEVGARFEAAHGHTVSFSFGSSGTLTRQLLQGAPFEIFLSADETFVQTLVHSSLTEGEGDVYAIGRLVLFIPAGSNIPPDSPLTELGSLLAEGRMNRLAIANPEHAPYGNAAKTVLQNAELWKLLRGKLIVGANAAQTAQFAVSGSVDAALMPYSLAMVPFISQRGSFEMVADILYTPLVHRMVLLKHAHGAAREFYTYLSTEETRQILAKHGLSPHQATAKNTVGQSSRPSVRRGSVAE